MGLSRCVALRQALTSGVQRVLRVKNESMITSVDMKSHFKGEGITLLTLLIQKTHLNRFHANYGLLYAIYTK